MHYSPSRADFSASVQGSVELKDTPGPCSNDVACVENIDDGQGDDAKFYGRTYTLEGACAAGQTMYVPDTPEPCVSSV